MTAVLAFLVACIVLGIIWRKTLQRNYFSAALTMVMAILIISLLYSIVILLVT